MDMAVRRGMVLARLISSSDTALRAVIEVAIGDGNVQNSRESEKTHTDLGLKAPVISNGGLFHLI